MRILLCEAKNFGSYKEISINFELPNLSLVYGPTGAGKSTIPDVVAWALFGTTAKDGAADDVRAWQADEPTTAMVEVHTDRPILVTRIRGKGANDLYFQIRADGEPTRGKDITETQKLLEQVLGVSADLFIAASYYHEFSPAGNFFTAKAKDRRTLFEMLAPLDLPKTLHAKASEERRAAKAEHDNKKIRQALLKGQYEQIQQSVKDNLRRSQTWKAERHARLDGISKRVETFQDSRKARIAATKKSSAEEFARRSKEIDALVYKIEQADLKILPNSHFIELAALGNTCKHCGAPYKSKRKIELLAEKGQNDDLKYVRNHMADRLEALMSSQDSTETQVAAIVAETNPHQAHLTAENIAEDPHQAALEESVKEECATLAALTTLNMAVGALQDDIGAFTALCDLTHTLRAKLLHNAVKRIQDHTNKLLEEYFDSELRVEFEADDADAIDVKIQNSGYDCNFKQLSKGQRGLLKLTFSLACMSAASNRAGIHFDNLWLDEALDGLDSELKLKAFRLLEHLATEHHSVLVIDHSPDFQNMFAHKYHVTMKDDYSHIEVQNE